MGSLLNKRGRPWLLPQRAAFKKRRKTVTSDAITKPLRIASGPGAASSSSATTDNSTDERISRDSNASNQNSFNSDTDDSNNNGNSDISWDPDLLAALEMDSEADPAQVCYRNKKHYYLLNSAKDVFFK